MNATDNRSTIAILAGGKSRRMGYDKASVLIERRTMIERVAAIAQGTGLPCIVVGRDPSATWELDLPFVEDRRPGLGPLAGLHAALHAGESDIVLLSCDLPGLTAVALDWLLEIAAGESSGLAGSRERPEPLFAVYRQSIVEEVDRRIARHELSMQRLIKATGMRIVPVPTEHALALDDVDTPEQLQGLRNG
ncbi:MAG: molybdopterin-guanine dinucleotide biosynthesis protein A [Bradymonadia bacterium]|jgi:molybdopterin-guanine dinucleotide biosynthesis protein A